MSFSAMSSSWSSAVDLGLLYRTLADPDNFLSDGWHEWQVLLATARVSGHLERVAASVSFPARLAVQLCGAQHVAAARLLSVRVEVEHLQRALPQSLPPVMLLKGAAYLCHGLTFAETRRSSDIDILTRHSHLPEITHQLSAHGWQAQQLHAYDDFYFREWMHELPPYRHKMRGTFLDIHHALLPKTSRLQPNTEKVWERAVQLPDSPLLVPCPEDMVLHCAFHAYHQGEFDNAPRDVIDMFDLLSHFTKNDPEFWARLVDRAAVIGVVPPLWHALSITHFIFDIGPPPAVQAHLDTLFPRTRSRDFVQRLIRRVTSYPVQTDAKAARAQALLHARSHYLRMPLPILARHLATKSFYNWQRGREAAKAQKAHLQQFKQ